MDAMLVSMATASGQKKLCHRIALARYGHHFIQNLVTVGKQETCTINSDTSSNASIIKPEIYFTLEEMHLLMRVVYP
eukprot:8628722-Ditylum_brightwellii.AAC.1